MKVDLIITHGSTLYYPIVEEDIRSMQADVI